MTQALADYAHLVTRRWTVADRLSKKQLQAYLNRSLALKWVDVATIATDVASEAVKLLTDVVASYGEISAASRGFGPTWAVYEFGRRLPRIAQRLSRLLDHLPYILQMIVLAYLYWTLYQISSMLVKPFLVPRLPDVDVVHDKNARLQHADMQIQKAKRRIETSPLFHTDEERKRRAIEHARVALRMLEAIEADLPPFDESVPARVALRGRQRWTRFLPQFLADHIDVALCVLTLSWDWTGAWLAHSATGVDVYLRDENRRFCRQLRQAVVASDDIPRLDVSDIDRRIAAVLAPLIAHVDDDDEKEDGRPRMLDSQAAPSADYSVLQLLALVCAT